MRPGGAPEVVDAVLPAPAEPAPPPPGPPPPTHRMEDVALDERAVQFHASTDGHNYDQRRVTVARDAWHTVGTMSDASIQALTQVMDTHFGSRSPREPDAGPPGPSNFIGNGRTSGDASAGGSLNSTSGSQRMGNR